MHKPPLTILLAAPRGFCAGVDRAIQIVERALVKYGPPVYVRHEIVHNKYVVDNLKAQGAVFVDELDQIPDDGQPVIFSAHGVPKIVPQAAKQRQMMFFDATCPLVSKVHVEAERHYKNGRQIILIGHEGHPEVVGTMGQLPEGAVVLVETVEDVANLLCHSDRTLRSSCEAGGVEESSNANGDVRSLDCARDDIIHDEHRLAYCTQTTLSVDDTAQVVEALRARFPNIEGPHKEDICYATTNRQDAVKQIAGQCEAMIVIGAPNSSNSQRLVEVALRHGCQKAVLVQRATEIDWEWLEGVSKLGITAGASAPEILVEEVMAALSERFETRIIPAQAMPENIKFKMPRELENVEENNLNAPERACR